MNKVMWLLGWKAAPAQSPRSSPRRSWRWFVLGTTFMLLIAWFGVGTVVRHRVDDNLAFEPPARTARGSLTIDVTAGLITREVDQHGWQANDPWFYPNALNDNAGHFQMGLMWSLSRLTSELTDRAGRLGSGGRVDEDLQRATGLLQYPGDIWVLDMRALLPAPSEAQYRAGRDALLAYNQRLSEGKAAFETRADNLTALLNRIARDLGSESESIGNRLAQSNTVVSRSADDLFYQVKGAVYGYTMLLKALEVDFAPVIKDSRLKSLWAAAEGALDEAASLRPLIVLDAPLDGALFANHLVAQGFYVLRAQARIGDIVRALQI